MNLYDRCKELLDTNGNGWSDPITDFSQFKTKVEPLDLKKRFNEDETMKACVNLAMNQNDNDNEEDMLVPLPKIEADVNEELSTIWLPLKRKHIFNINSKSSAFILFRYFVLVTQCYMYQGINQSIFNQKLNAWLVEEVLPYLDDEKLYPAFGAVLRILETVKGPNENSYQGTKPKPSGRGRFAGHRIQFTDNDEAILFKFDTDKDFDLWIRGALMAGVIFLLLIIFITVCVRRKTKHKDAWTETPEKLSLMQRFKKCLFRNSHRPEADEFYQYKKVPREPRRVVFENEKMVKRGGLFRKSRRNDKDEFDLPLLGNATDSDDEIVLHNSHTKKTRNKTESSDLSGTSWSGSRMKKGNSKLFKISDSSADEKLKKHQKPSAGNYFKGSNEPTGTDFSRLGKQLSRSKSPVSKPGEK